MLPGRLVNLTIKSPVVTRELGVEKIGSWTTVATVKASLQPLRGREIEEWSRRGTEVSHVAYTNTKVSVSPRMVAQTDDGVTYLCRFTLDEGGQARVWSIHLMLKDDGLPNEVPT